MRLQITCDDREMQRALQQAVEAVTDMAPLMKSIAGIVWRSTMDNFTAQGFEGHAWPKLSAAYANSREVSARSRIADYAASERKFKGVMRMATAGEVASYTKRTTRAYAKNRDKGVGRVRGYDSILNPTGRHIKNRIAQSHTSNEARVGCSQGWAWVHNYGASLRSAKMPQRTFMGIQGKDRDSIIQAAQEHIRRAVGA